MNEALLVYLVMGFGVMVTTLCAWSALKPDSLADWLVRLWEKPWSVPLAVCIRLVVGVALIAAAPMSRQPTVLAIVGWLAIAGAVFVLAAGKERVSRMIGWVLRWPPVVMRAWSLIGVAFGIFLVWSVS